MEMNESVQRWVNEAAAMCRPDAVLEPSFQFDAIGFLINILFCSGSVPQLFKTL